MSPIEIEKARLIGRARVKDRGHGLYWYAAIDLDRKLHVGRGG